MGDARRWQYRVEPVTDRTIVFHDSLLPRYRGFAPTATALINGDCEIGITAIRPVEAVDAGPILGQRRWMVEYPIRARAALERQAVATADLAGNLLHEIVNGTLMTTEQDPMAATYSLWRDEQDYFIDWTRSAETICRTIDALSYPFMGARTRIDGREVIVDEARIVDDLVFERRDIGKIWSLDPDGPIVVCGRGCLRVTAAHSTKGEPFIFKRLRSRLT
ncbi:hypothetical protein BAL199_14642 [alpha proteobacterium BAL199]|nr:hypothetical protein BAL199_14642 [alpha proteobacterium BAL199]